MPDPSCPLPTRAYNISLLHQQGHPGPDSHGWCFGLPPGIAPEQWPLDPQTGYPLVHGLTLRLPQDYRCHGPDITGLSFFVVCPEHTDGGTVPDEAILSAMTGEGPPEDARYRPFWEAAQNSHPRLYRMSDILGDSFAAILLNDAELNGPLCMPPDTRVARAVASHPSPRWLEVGGGYDYFEAQTGSWARSLGRKVEEHFLFKILGEAPQAQLDWRRALRWQPRAKDPNAGKAPEDPHIGPKVSGYQRPYYYEGGVIKAENHREHAWTADHAPNHIGGTMRPVQATPRFSPFYIEFEEYLGGYNFGGGNCQLDLLNIQLDWACG